MKSMSEIKKLFSYYRPYRRLFITDLLFAVLSAAIALAIPMVVRYVTNTLIYCESSVILQRMCIIAVCLFILLAADCYARYYIGYVGHVMGAKIEYDMREEIFAHMPMSLSCHSLTATRPISDSEALSFQAVRNSGFRLQEYS